MWGSAGWHMANGSASKQRSFAIRELKPENPCWNIMGQHLPICIPLMMASLKWSIGIMRKLRSAHLQKLLLSLNSERQIQICRFELLIAGVADMLYEKLMQVISSVMNAYVIFPPLVLEVVCEPSR